MYKTTTIHSLKQKEVYGEQSLQLVVVILELREFHLETLSLSGVHDDGVGLGSFLHWVVCHVLKEVMSKTQD